VASKVDPATAAAAAAAAAAASPLFAAIAASAGNFSLPFSLPSLWKKRADILPPEVRHQLEMMQKMEEIRELNAGHKQQMIIEQQQQLQQQQPRERPKPASKKKKKSYSTESSSGSVSPTHGERSKSSDDQQQQREPQQSTQVTEYENQIQNDRYPVDCIKCSLRLNSLAQFNDHMNDHWSEDKCCPVCGLLINSKRFNFKQHLKIHTGEKPFVCQVCNRSFRQKAHMVKHITTHRNGGGANAAELAAC